MTNQTTPATKAQLDRLIELLNEYGYNEEAGLIKLASDSIDEKVRNAEEEERKLNTSNQYSMCPDCSPEGGRHYDSKFQNCFKCGASLIEPADETCNCYEIEGDNKDCPKHGDMFNHGAFSDDEIKEDYRERAEMYAMGMGY